MNKYNEALNYFLEREEGENLTVTCDWLNYAEDLKELLSEFDNGKVRPLEELEYTLENES